MKNKNTLNHHVTHTKINHGNKSHVEQISEWFDAIEKKIIETKGKVNSSLSRIFFFK